ncbi:MAG TPA: hypothetical protein VGO98_01180 [Candidatus Saccharimonadales bacterium]|jgi:hypothetical protein|nr:hypothetical protein [Candidatus Saccharimonadales bacterium]
MFLSYPDSVMAIFIASSSSSLGECNSAGISLLFASANLRLLSALLQLNAWFAWAGNGK